MEKMRHKSKLSSPVDQDNSNDPPRKQAKIIGATISENVSNGNNAQCSNSLSTNHIYQLVTKPQGGDEVQIIKKNKKSDEVNMLDSVRALLTCAVCLEVDNHSNQCINGHIICSSCSLRLMQQTGCRRPKCPSCRTSLRLGLRRCLLAEQLADELPIQCFYCKEKVLRRQLHNHEVDTCPKRPALCRFSLVGCPWQGLGDEVHKHAAVCHYRLKSLGEIEPLLVDNILRHVAYNTETRLFTNGLLYLLKRYPYGLNIYQRQVGVFRDISDDMAQNNGSQPYKYVSENSFLQCAGIRKVLTEVEIDLAESKLQYRLINKAEGKASLSVRLCSIRCGDMEFYVYDQIRNVNFDESLKETPTYSALITCNSGVDNNQQERKRLDSLIFKHNLLQLRPNVIQKSNLLVLDFILLCHRREKLDVQFGEGNLNNPATIFTTPFGATAMPDLSNEIDVIPEVEGGEDSTLQVPRRGFSCSSLQSFLREMVHSPGSNILRPLISLISSQDENNPVNNNAQAALHTRPSTTVITVTNLNQRGTTHLEGTNSEEDEEDDDGIDSEESTADGNQDESIDSSSDDDENSSEESIRLSDGQSEERNNNALTNDEQCHSLGGAKQSNPLNKDTSETGVHPCRTIGGVAYRCCTNSYGNSCANNSGINDLVHGAEQSQTVDEQGKKKQNTLKRNRRETTKSPSLIKSTPVKKIRRTHTASRESNSRLAKTTARRRIALIHKPNSKRGSSKTAQDSAKIESTSSDSRSNEMTENLIPRSSDDACCRTPQWLEKVLRTVSQITRYFIRSHVMLSPSEAVTSLPLNEVPATDYTSQVHPVESSSTETAAAQTSLTPSTSLDSGSTLLMSLRGDIPGEIIRLARTVTHGLIPMRREQVGDGAPKTSPSTASPHTDSFPVEKNTINNRMNDSATGTRTRRKSTVCRSTRKQR